MPTFITMLILGAIMCVLGTVNMTGNISSLHSYHRHRVSAADVKPFGKLVGLGTIIIGVSVALFGTFMFISENKTYKYFMNAKNDVYIELKIESSTRNKLEKLYIHQDGEIYKYIEDDDDFSKNIKQHYTYSFIPQNIELSLPDKTQYTIIE